MLIDFHVGVTRWREEWIARRGRRVRGVWDSHLDRGFVTLRDSRRITYFVDGPPSSSERLGRPALPHIFCFHGMFLSGNCFLMTNPPEDYVLVCINRPGYFGSDSPPADYSYESFARDIEQVANALKIDRFHVVGHSSGGPNALACAAHLGKRVLSIGILSGDPEYAHDGVPNKSARNSFLLGTFLPKLLWLLPCVPVARQARPGLINDYRLETAMYSFRTEHITQPALVFVGADDQVMSLEVSRHVHERLDDSTYRIIPRIGHNGLLRDEGM